MPDSLRFAALPAFHSPAHPSAITDTVNVVFEDIYKTKSLTVNYSGSQVYDYPAVGDAIADHALSVIHANAGVAQYSGAYTSINPFQMKQVTKRTVSFRETGTSTEDRIRFALDRLDDVQRITLTTTGYAGVPGTRWDFNYGRGNDWWEDDKDYEVDPTKYDRSYGSPVSPASQASPQSTTMRMATASKTGSRPSSARHRTPPTPGFRQSQSPATA